jgi:hypothetical protein
MHVIVAAKKVWIENKTQAAIKCDRGAGALTWRE